MENNGKGDCKGTQGAYFRLGDHCRLPLGRDI